MFRILKKILNLPDIMKNCKVNLKGILDVSGHKGLYTDFGHIDPHKSFESGFSPINKVK